ncbi:hypothetical protein C8R43DRAFT_1047666 [Mycena crocata]|nr:hypothetical protein C8R43DRAFT_1047666 [Mycena crocata]
MSAVAFAYGSFGDILATAQLIAKVAIALHRSGKPSKEGMQTEQELKLLGHDLAQLTVMHTDDTIDLTSSTATYAASRIQAEVRSCHRIMAKFFEKISASRGLLQKVLWAGSEDKELAAFKMQVIERRTALSNVVGLLNSGALNAVHDRVEEVGVQLAGLGINMHDGVGELSRQLKSYQEQIVAVIGHIPRGPSAETFVVSIFGAAIDIPIL